MGCRVRKSHKPSAKPSASLPKLRINLLLPVFDFSRSELDWIAAVIGRAKRRLLANAQAGRMAEEALVTGVPDQTGRQRVERLG
jgi:hypothetical protein